MLGQYRCLLVWDNVETVASMPQPGQATPPLDEDGQAALKGFVDGVAQSRSALLITSRADEAWLDEDRPADQRHHRLEVAGLARDDATRYANHLLARSQVPPARQDDKFLELMERLAGHPFSMRLLLPRLKEQSAATILAGLKGEAELPPGFTGDESRGLNRTLGTSLDYSLRQLGEEDRSRLVLLSLVEDTVDAVALGIMGELDAVTLPGRFRGLGPDHWRALLDRCAGLGLLSSWGGGVYRLHPALAGYLAAAWREQAGDPYADEREQALTTLIHAYADLSGYFLTQIQGGNAAMAFAHLALQRRTLGALLETALDRQLFGPAQQMLEPLNAYWNARGEGAEADAWVGRVVAATRPAPSEMPDLESEAGALWLFAVGSRANRAYLAGDLATAEAAHDRIRQALEADGGDKVQPHLAVAYHQLGIVAQLRGDLDTAEGWYKRSLAIREGLGNRPGMASTYYQLGSVAQLRGHLDTAEGWYRRALAIREKLGDRPGMASTYHQLGMVAQDRGDLDAAEGWCRQALKMLVPRWLV